MQRFYVIRLTASSNGGFEGSLSLAESARHLTLLVYKDNSCQTTGPLTSNKGEVNNQRADVCLPNLSEKLPARK